MPELEKFRVGGFDDESAEPTQPVRVTCTVCREASGWFTYRNDGGADTTAPLDVLFMWARDHQCAGKAGA